MESAIDAVNEGNIFRFLTKPCSTDVLLKALDACCEQYRLVLPKKFCSNKLCAAASRPSSTFCRWRILSPSGAPPACPQNSVEQLMTHFEIRERWPVEVAAMLSQIGCVTLPPATLEKLYKGAPPSSPSEQEMVDRMPAVVEKCLCQYSAHRIRAGNSAPVRANLCKPSIVPHAGPTATCPGALAP